MLTDRIMGVLRLDVDTFEDVEADESATTQAAMIVVAVAVLTAIGAFFAARTGNAFLDTLDQFAEMDLPFEVVLSPTAVAINAFIGVFVTWVLWSALTYFIGTQLFEGEATMGEMLRVIGFAQAPQLFKILSFIPCLGPVISFVASIWSLATGFVGIRQGLDLDNAKTLITIVVSWFVAMLVNWLVISPIMGLLGL